MIIIGGRHPGHEQLVVLLGVFAIAVCLAPFATANTPTHARNIVVGAKAGSVSSDRVEFDDEWIRSHRGRLEEAVQWDDLSEIAIVTTDAGPWCEDAYWLLVGKTRGCAIANGA